MMQSSHLGMSLFIRLTWGIIMLDIVVAESMGGPDGGESRGEEGEPREILLLLPPLLLTA